jgi:hypothetical protein
MDNTQQKQDIRESSSAEEQQKIAIPYTPPSPPDNSQQKKFKSPLVNGILVSLVILIGGFMTYNFVGHQLTQLEDASDVRVSVSHSPSISPSDTPIPTITPSSSY